MESEVQTSEAREESGPRLGFGGKLINIFTSPSKTFEAIDRKPTWLVPFIIMIVVSLGSAYLIMPQLVNVAVENITKQGDVPPEQLEITMKAIPIGILSMAVIWVPVWFFLFSGIYYLVGTVFLGGNSTYKKILSVQAWSSFIMILSSIVSVPLIMIKNSAYISLSPAILLSADHLNTKLYIFMSQFNFFYIWYLVVLAIGFTSIYKFSKAKAFTTVGILWCIWIALSLAFGGLSG